MADQHECQVVAVLPSGEIPCVSHEGGKHNFAQVSAQDEDGSSGQGRPLPAVEHISGGIQLAAGDPPTPVASADFEALARDMLSRFTKTSDGHRARVGQVQIAKWAEQLEGGGNA